MVEREIRRKWQRSNRKSWNRRPKAEKVKAKKKGKPHKRDRKALRKLKGKRR